jgi:hypothetical protein
MRIAATHKFTPASGVALARRWHRASKRLQMAKCGNQCRATKEKMPTDGEAIPRIITKPVGRDIPVVIRGIA